MWLDLTKSTIYDPVLVVHSGPEHKLWSQDGAGFDD